LEQAHIATSYVNRHYLDAMLTPDRMADLQRAVTSGAVANRDFSPVLYFRCLRLWASQFNTRFGILEAALALALVVYMARLRGVVATVFASGFAASSLEVVLLLGFQALCGSLYYQLGIIVTVFMAGLAAGAAWGSRVKGNSRLWLAAAALCVAALAFLVPLLLKMLTAAEIATQPGIVALTFAIAAPVGAQFPLANRVEFNGTNAPACRLYTADFTGAFLGALLASTLLVPLIGVKGVCALAGAFNALAAGALCWKQFMT
jgi:predicted membrane-bound spermidine synthase